MIDWCRGGKFSGTCAITRPITSLGHGPNLRNVLARISRIRSGSLCAMYCSTWTQRCKARGTTTSQNQQTVQCGLIITYHRSPPALDPKGQTRQLSSITQKGRLTPGQRSVVVKHPKLHQRTQIGLLVSIMRTGPDRHLVEHSGVRGMVLFRHALRGHS